MNELTRGAKIIATIGPSSENPAVLEKSGAVMLSEETAIGQYPMEAVRIMDKMRLP